jgi:hypothetical protein
VVPGPDSLPPHIRDFVEAQNSSSRIVRAMDYLVVSAEDNAGRTPAGHAGPVELPYGVRIEQIDDALAERLFDATSPRGEDWSPTRSFHAVHAYVREVWTEDGGHAADGVGRWDHERRLWPVAQLSRLIRDDNASTEYAVQRQIRADGSERLVPFDGYESHVVYRLYPEQAGWLDCDEAVELKALIEAFWSEPDLPARVRRALRQADAVTGERYVEDAMPQVVGAFESLVKIGHRFVTAQFSQRVPALVAEVGVELSVAECRDVYDDRSALVHGAGLDLSVPHEFDEFGRRFNSLQEALRRVVRRAIEDRDFAAIFEDDARITQRWPATIKVRIEVEKTI